MSARPSLTVEYLEPVEVQVEPRRRPRAEAHDIAACAPGGAVEVLGGGVVRPWSVE